MVSSAVPASIQALACLQASRSTQRPSGTISPQSSATEMNFTGGMSPSTGCRQRINVSALRTLRFARSTFG
jgi:hypothetical protein